MCAAGARAPETAIRLCARDQTEGYKSVHSSDRSEPPATPRVDTDIGDSVSGTSDELTGADSDLARQSTVYSEPLRRTLTLSDSAGSGGAQPKKPCCVPNSLARAGGCRRTPHEPHIDAEKAHI